MNYEVYLINILAAYIYIYAARIFIKYIYMLQGYLLSTPHS